MDKLNIYSVSDLNLSTIESIVEIPEFELSCSTYDWLREADVYNKNNEKITYKWLKANADIIVLIFTLFKADKGGFMNKFGEIYEISKRANIPIEVINVPMDETIEEMEQSYMNQANWFTLAVNDPLIPVLKYMFEISCVPLLRVFSIDGKLVSRDGIADIDQYGRNAVISWLTTPCNMKQHRDFTADFRMYGPQWNFLGMGKKIKRRFGGDQESGTRSTSTATSPRWKRNIKDLITKVEEIGKKTGDDKKKPEDDGKKVVHSDEKAGDDMKKAENDEKKVGDDKKKAEDGEKKAEEDEKKTGDDEKKTGDEEKKAGDDEKKTGDDEKKTADDEKKTGDDEKKTGDDEKKTGDDETNTGDAEKKTDDEKKAGGDEEVTGDDKKITGGDEEKTGDDGEKTGE